LRGAADCEGEERGRGWGKADGRGGGVRGEVSLEEKWKASHELEEGPL